MSNSRGATVAIAALAVAALVGAGLAAGRWLDETARAQGNTALSSVALAELPVHLTQTREIRPTGQVKRFELTAQRAAWELLPGVVTQAVTYNGTVPGPTLRATEGDTVRVVLRNALDQETSIHWHGLHVPNAMDGVPGLTQPPVRPGETFTYEFTASHAGTFMYHPHINSVAQIDNGLYGLLIIDPQQPDPTRFDKEFTMMLGAWMLRPPAAGHGPASMPGMGGPRGGEPTARAQVLTELLAAGAGDARVTQFSQALGLTPAQGLDVLRGVRALGGAAAGGQTEPPGGMEMDYNYFTINGKAYPAVEPWTVKQGDLVRVRIVNISNLGHPMHLHGQDFKVIAKDGEPLREQWIGNTLSVAPGETYDIVFLANNPGIWVFHCHELHHTENAGVEPGGLVQVIQYEGAVPSSAPAPAAAPTTMPANMPGMRH